MLSVPLLPGETSSEPKGIKTETNGLTFLLNSLIVDLVASLVASIIVVCSIYGCSIYASILSYAVRRRRKCPLLRMRITTWFIISSSIDINEGGIPCSKETAERRKARRKDCSPLVSLVSALQRHRAHIIQPVFRP